VRSRGPGSRRLSRSAPRSGRGAAELRAASLRFRNLKVEFADGVAVVTLNRPEARNAIDLATVDDLHRALDILAHYEKTRVVILTGAGKSFASGADLHELRRRRAADALRGINSGLFLQIERFPLPTIAAVNGYALGGGCELALACDLRLAAQSARFGQPEAGLGIIPAAGAAYRLPRLIGAGRARELIFTGRIVDSEEALRIGLVNRVVPDERLLDEARATAAAIARKSPLALRVAKRVLSAAASGTEAGSAAEDLGQGILFGSSDRDEGIGAFLRGRAPRFKGR
jgi:enoyl-CoA hydratase